MFLYVFPFRKALLETRGVGRSPPDLHPCIVALATCSQDLLCHQDRVLATFHKFRAQYSRHSRLLYPQRSRATLVNRYSKCLPHAVDILKATPCCTRAIVNCRRHDQPSSMYIEHATDLSTLRTHLDYNSSLRARMGKYGGLSPSPLRRTKSMEKIQTLRKYGRKFQR